MMNEEDQKKFEEMRKKTFIGAFQALGEALIVLRNAIKRSFLDDLDKIGKFIK